MSLDHLATFEFRRGPIATVLALAPLEFLKLTLYDDSNSKLLVGLSPISERDPHTLIH